jgi:MFS transporter, PPP family, 3-phenylpropionic acid transporter
MNKLWLFCFNLLYYGSSAFFTPFLVLYYQSLQFNGIEIGLLTGATPLIYLISAPFFTNLADSTNWHRHIMVFCIGLVLLVIALLPFAQTFGLILLLVIALYVFMGPISPFVDSATMQMLGDEKDMYGRVRLGGTIGWAIAAILAGAIVEAYGLRAAFWGSSILLVIPFFITWKLVFRPTKDSIASRPSVKTLLQNPLWIRFLAIAFVGGVAVAVSGNYFFIYMKELGTPESMMGIALSLGTVVEIPVLFFGNYLLANIKPYRLLILAMLLMGLRLLLFGLVNTLWLVLLIQPLGGLAFVLSWMAGVAYANEHAPENLSSTAQGLFSAMIFGFGAAMGGLLGGLLLEQMTVQNIYLVVGIGVFLAIGVVTAIWPLLPDKKLKNA